MRRGLAAPAPSWGPSLPSCVVRGLWETLKDAGGVTPGDAAAGIAGDTSRGWEGTRGILGDSARSPSPPCAGTRAFPVLSDKGPEPALCQHFQAVFHAGTRPSNRSRLGFQPFPSLAPHCGLFLGRERAQ